MIDQRDVVLPRWNGRLVPSKPPLFHWLVIVGAQASGAGVTSRTLRAPSVLLGAMIVIAVLVAGTTWGGRDVGLLAALVLATTPQFIDEAGNGRVDMTLAAAVTGAQLAVVQMLGRRGGNRAPLAAALGAALAMLAKGPVGPGLVGLSALAFAARERHVAGFRPLFRFLPVFVFLLVGGGWYVLATFHQGADFIAKQIVSENGEALLGGERIPYRSPLFYVPRLVLGGLPWTVCLPWAVARAWSGERPRRYCLAWVVAGFVLFSLAPLKRGAYLLPLRPALALVMGWWLAEAVGAAPFPGRVRRAIMAAAGALAVTIAACTAVVAALVHGVLPLAVLQPVVRDVDIGRVVALLAGHEGELVVLGLGAAAAAVVGGAAVARGDTWRAIVATAGSTACLILLAQSVVAPVRATLESVRPFALAVRERVPPGEPLGLLTASEEIPFLFYLGRDVPVLGDAGRRLRDVGPGYYVLPQERWEAWRERAGWEEMLRSPDLPSRHRADLVLVRFKRGAPPLAPVGRSPPGPSLPAR